MKLSIMYNWPVGKDTANVSLSMHNTEDPNYHFRLSVLDKKASDEWLSSGWVNYDEVDKLSCAVSKNSVIRVDRKNKESSLITKLEIECSKDWPIDAQGDTIIDTGYWF